MSRIRLAFGASVAVVAAPALLAGALGLMHHSQRPPAVRVSPVAMAAVTALRKATHPVLGVFEPGSPPSYAPIREFRKAVDHTPRLVLMFTGIGSKFPDAYAQRAHLHGAHLLLQINPGNIKLRTIASDANGWINRWLRGYAQQVAEFGYPVVIGFGHEMNGNWYPWGYTHQPASEFIAAWRHIVNVFRQEGAKNALWLWTISHHIRYTAPLRTYWPGKSYVDWVGIDGYYYHRSDTFAGVFGHKIRQVHALTHKPILLSEVGIGPVAGQQAKLPALFRGIRDHHLAGLVWFDVHQHGGIYKQDWRLEDNRAGLAAFRKGLAMLKVRP